MVVATKIRKKKVFFMYVDNFGRVGRERERKERGREKSVWLLIKKLKSFSIG